MKEIIELEGKIDIKYLKELEKEHDEKIMSFPEYQEEQIPETFEELKDLTEDLCKKKKIKFNYFYPQAENEGFEIAFFCQRVEGVPVHETIRFYKNGKISIACWVIFQSKKYSVPAMWQIIKNLIGEEQ